ncbi:hypothetical protein F442_21856 [Phytophthora nicotianae P10297]|uniref:RxLR effector protein n=3 Tax=Phytophthora nicotianae TaxID=4792 RepID=V9DWD7_PHYNI|nr:hypothetical protein F443_21993 [Phytophthora nicotianae P1569]ETO59692.1 hypothetical protein F444_22013 [Phytophthora nicotianae P1976]ETP28915.1 hypothetical protein F442_21856 [Phytophthora nicotianae P10297]
MRFYFAVVVAACMLSAIANAAAQGLTRAVPAIQKPELNPRRFLRADAAGFKANEVNDEERAFLTNLKTDFMNFNIDRWLNKGLLPKEVSAKLKINGAGELHKNYKYLQQYATKWDEAGNPVHVSLAYHQKRLEDLDEWFRLGFTTEGVLRQLKLFGVHGKKLKDHKNYPYYIKYLDMLRAKNRAGNAAVL